MPGSIRWHVSAGMIFTVSVCCNVCKNVRLLFINADLRCIKYVIIFAILKLAHCYVVSFKADYRSSYWLGQIWLLEKFLLLLSAKTKSMWHFVIELLCCFST
jgi:hypothetical protein